MMKIESPDCVTKKADGKSSDDQQKRPALSELMKAHLDEVAGGLAGHVDWNSRTVCIPGGTH